MKKTAYKPVRLFPILHDISDFIQNEHPVYHPDSISYVQYWEKVEKRCLEGYWGLDKNKETGEGGYRWMPPNLYYYINLCVIEDEDEFGNTVKVISPELRDVEWILSYAWITARGFSGFEDDDEYTCHRIVGKLQQGKKLNKKEEFALTKYKKTIYKPGTDELKTYVEAREYLSRTFQDPMGRALYENDALNLFILGSRGFGKSFFGANAVVGHEYNFYGKKRFDESYLIDPEGPEIFVGAGIAAKSSDMLKKFSRTQERLKKVVGAWGSGEDFIPGYFYNNSKGSLKPNNSDSPYEHKYSAKEGGTWVEKGSGTKILHGIYTTENPQAAVGTRPTVMLIEEVGLLGNVLTVHGANETCQVRKNKFGSSLYIGTGGNMEKITESKIIFDDPESYNFLGFKDHWENRAKPIGLFIPAYYVDNDFKDKNGNTRVEEALAYEIQIREQKRKASTSSALDEYMMARPLVPSEMFLTAAMKIFPTALIRERRTEVEIRKLFDIKASIGWLEYADSEKKSVVWKEDLDRRLRPIQTMNLDAYKGNINGAVVIYEHPPEYLPAPKFKNNLYKVVYDPVKDDGGGTSLASILVYKGFSDKSWEQGMQGTIVAEYIGRFDKVNDMHEIAIKLALYYNAKILPEVNIPDFVRYCRMNNKSHMLQPSPYVAISKVIANPSKKYDVGVNMTNQLNLHCEQLLRQFLLEKWGEDEDGEPLYNLHKFYSLRALSELEVYDRIINTDHVSSLKLLALWLSQEQLDPIGGPDSEELSEMKPLDEFLKQKARVVQAKNPFYAY